MSLARVGLDPLCFLTRDRPQNRRSLLLIARFWAIGLWMHGFEKQPAQKSGETP
jgi:hypothetical protein